MFNGVNIAAQYMDGAGGKYGTGKTTKIVLILWTLGEVLGSVIFFFYFFIFWP